MYPIFSISSKEWNFDFSLQFQCAICKSGHRFNVVLRRVQCFRTIPLGHFVEILLGLVCQGQPWRRERLGGLG